jgi:hypothetical protein
VVSLNLCWPWPAQLFLFLCLIERSVVLCGRYVCWTAVSSTILSAFSRSPDILDLWLAGGNNQLHVPAAEGALKPAWTDMRGDSCSSYRGSNSEPYATPLITSRFRPHLILDIRLILNSLTAWSRILLANTAHSQMGRKLFHLLPNQKCHYYGDISP